MVTVIGLLEHQEVSAINGANEIQGQPASIPETSNTPIPTQVASGENKG